MNKKAISIAAFILAVLVFAALLIMRNVKKEGEETPETNSLADFLYTPIPPETFGDIDPPEGFWIKLEYSPSLPMYKRDTYTLFDTANAVLGKFMPTAYGNTEYIETGFDIGEDGKRLLYSALLYYNIKKMRGDIEYKSEMCEVSHNSHYRLTFRIEDRIYRLSYDATVTNAINEEKIVNLAYFHKVMMDYICTTPEYNDPLAYLSPDTSGLPEGFYVRLEFSSDPDFPATDTYTYIDSAKNRVGEPHSMQNSYRVYQYYRYTHYYPKAVLKEICDVITKHGLCEFSGGIYTKDDWVENAEEGLNAYYRLSFCIGGEQYSFVYDNTFIDTYIPYNFSAGGTGERIRDAHYAIMGFYSAALDERGRLGFDYSALSPVGPPEDFWLTVSALYRGVDRYVLIDTKEAVLGRIGMESYNNVISRYDSENLSFGSIQELSKEAYIKLLELDIEPLDGLKFLRTGEHYPAVPRFMFILEFGYDKKICTISFERDIDGHYHGDRVKDIWEFFAHLMRLAAVTPEYGNMPRLDNMWTTPP